MTLAEFAKTDGGRIVIVWDNGHYALCPCRTGGVLLRLKDRKACVAALIAAGYAQQPNKDWAKT